MNAAARLLTHSHISRTWVVAMLISKLELSRVVLILSVLISALSIIYVTNLTRSFNANLEQIFTEREALHVEWGQLLLEKSTCTSEARIQKLAQDKLDMVAPDSKSTVIISAANK